MFGIEWQEASRWVAYIYICMYTHLCMYIHVYMSICIIDNDTMIFWCMCHSLVFDIFYEYEHFLCRFGRRVEAI